MAAPSMAEVLAERWGCAPGHVDPQYGAVCNSSNHTPALYGSACVFVADAAQALAAAGFGHVGSVERERDLAIRTANVSADFRVAAAEAQVAAVRALADEIEALSRSLSPCTGPDCAGCQLGRVASRIRRALDGEATP